MVCDMSNFINDTLQKQIERGEVFYALKNFFLDGKEIDEILISTSTSECSLVADIMGGGGWSSYQLYEDSATSNDGTSIEAVNMNRNSSTTLATTLFYTPTISAAGTVILNNQIFPVDIRHNQDPLGTGAGIILEPSKKYRLLLSNTDGNDSAISVSMFLREL